MKATQKKKNQTIRKSLILFNISMLTLQVIVSVFISINFLEKYYLTKEESSFTHIYEKVITNDFLYSEDFYLFSKELIDKNISLFIYDTKTNLIEYPLEKKGVQFATGDSNSEFQFLLEQEPYKFTYIDNERQSLYLLTNKKDQISLIGSLPNKRYLLIQMPYSYIVYASRLTMRFSVLSWLFTLGIMIIPTVYYSIQFTNPIKKISKIANNISHFDFSEKCPVIDKNELGILAISINQMSESIQSYIHELKMKNIELEKDLQTKTRLENSQKIFISDVSHEIKTPISIISGYTEGLKYGLPKTEEEKLQYLDIILNECNQMSYMTQKLLDLSKIESGNYQLKKTNFNISIKIENIIKLFAIQIKHNLLSFENEIQPDLFVFADEEEVEKILTNLISNAIKYSNQSSIIKISSEVEQYVSIKIFNESQPFSDEELNTIWNRFSKKDNSRNKKIEGTGLGLSIVKASMELNNTPFSVVNKENGVEFSVSFEKKTCL